MFSFDVVEKLYVPPVGMLLENELFTWIMRKEGHDFVVEDDVRVWISASAERVVGRIEAEAIFCKKHRTSRADSSAVADPTQRSARTLRVLRK